MNFGCVVLGEDFEAGLEDWLVPCKGVEFREQLLEALEEADPNVGDRGPFELAAEEVDELEGFVLVGDEVVVVDLHQLEQDLGCLGLELVVELGVVEDQPHPARKLLDDPVGNVLGRGLDPLQAELLDVELIGGEGPVD